MTEQSPAEGIFFAALEKGTPEERVAYLDAACGDDTNLRRRVERLLAAHPQVGSFLQSPVQGEIDAAEAPTIPPGEQCPAGPGLAESTSYHSPGEVIGSIIAGRYKLLETLGQGGMGAVFMAQQTVPVKRLVALKLIKLGMDSKQVLTRFEAERQALALMDHPNIAKVLDAGATDSGGPFFVMELVKGVPITRFCDERQLSTRERLELFIPVCQAIQHAHQKGIIHRDIKPTNVLIALYDDRPVPKVIDFGVAKAIGSQLTDASLVTAFGAIVGTPEYMSPEQAQLNQLDIDTRSDVYALGVLLYELLTGTTPIDRKRLGQGALLEILRIICEEEPPRPSTRLSTSEALASIAATRRTEPAKLAKLMRGELDWIAMKCLEKDRSRRYETANGLARDLERYLHDEVVEARPASAGYRVRKFLRKHRGPVMTAGLVLAALLAGMAGMTWGLFEAVRGRRAAEVAERAERDERTKADAARLAAELSAASLQVDLDLAEIKTDQKLGLLRLVRTLKGMPADARDLREFAAFTILANGQHFAPLLPPITHNGQAVIRHSLSPDGKTVLTLGEDGTARLWDTRTAKQKAILREKSEKVVNCGYSPDGDTIFTDDLTSIARFWDAANGQLKAKTEQRPSRYSSPKLAAFEQVIRQADAHYVFRGSVQIHNGRAITFNHREDEKTGLEFNGPVELWDTATGGYIARLDKPRYSIRDFAFMGAGRWVTCAAGDSTWVVYSAHDGREVARLKDDEPIDWISESSGGKLVTVRSYMKRLRFNFWDTETWKVISRIDVPAAGADDGNEKIFDAVIVKAWSNHAYVCRTGQSEPIVIATDDDSVFGRLMIERKGDQFHLGDGRLFDAATWKQLRPSEGHKYHPDLKRFSLDGRFVSGFIDGYSLIDTLTEKYFCTQRDGNGWLLPIRNLPGLGLVSLDTRVATIKVNDNETVTSTELYASQINLIPTSHLDLPPNLLGLWAEVVVRGQPGEDGAFVKWDERTWEKNRQKLAAIPPPCPDLPFPGYVATDKLYWLQAEYSAATTDAEKRRLAKELLRRSEANGDKAEAVRWLSMITPRSSSTKPASKPSNR